MRSAPAIAAAVRASARALSVAERWRDPRLDDPSRRWVAEPAQSARRHRCRGGAWQGAPADGKGYSVEVTGAEIKTISKGYAPMTVDVASRVKDKVFDTTETVQVTADAVKQQVSEGTEALQTTAGQVASQAKDLTQQAVGAVFPPISARVEALMTRARQRPLPTAGVAIVVLVVLQLVVRRLLRGNE